jgi:hypothetical protein
MQLVLRSTVPAPRGSRLEGRIDVDGAALALRVKVRASKRQGEGEFLLTGRPLELARQYLIPWAPCE